MIVGSGAVKYFRVPKSKVKFTDFVAFFNEIWVTTLMISTLTQIFGGGVHLHLHPPHIIYHTVPGVYNTYVATYSIST